MVHVSLKIDNKLKQHIFKHMLLFEWGVECMMHIGIHFFIIQNIQSSFKLGKHYVLNKFSAF